MHSKRYDRNIDIAILSELYPKPGELFSNKTSFNKLYDKICSNYKTISKPTFSFHLKSMKNEQKLLDKDDNFVRGTSVSFFLTEAGKQKYRFYIQTVNSNVPEDGERLERIYQLLFLFVNIHFINALHSEEEFESFLSRIPISKDQLKIHSVKSDEEPYEDIDENMLILKGTTTTFRPIKSEILISKEEIEYLPLQQKVASLFETQNDTKKRLALQIQKRLKNENTRRSYSYDYIVPGVSQSDFIEDTSLKHVSFTKEEVNAIFGFLEKNHIIKPINDHLGEKRYSIDPVHESLRDLLSEYGGIKVMATIKMQLIWFNFRRLTHEEWKWYEFLKGKEMAIEYSKFAYGHRNSVRKARKERSLDYIASMKQKIDEFDTDISETLKDLEEKYSETIRNYNFPLKGLLEMIYPKFIQLATY
jgi:hypothetical protein